MPIVRLPGGELEIPERELAFTTGPSSGPGGQNVNKVETRVTLRFDVEASESLSEAQRARLRSRLGNRIGGDGVLAVTSQRHRSQAANRQDAEERFVELVGEALTPARRRRKTRVPKKAKRRRLEAKKRRAEKKRLRRPPKLD